MNKISVSFLLGLALLGGCKTVSAPVPLPPGAVNQADETFYQSLSAAQASLNSLKANELSTPQIKTALNQAIADYNLAEAAYQTYHAAMVAGQNPSPTAVSNAITAVQNDLTALKGAK